MRTHRGLRALSAVSTLSVLSTVVCLGAAPPANAAPQRWNVNVLGLQSWSIGWNDPEPLISYRDAHGHFTADDLDSDGVITFGEVIEIDFTDLSMMAYPFPPDEAMYAPDYGNFRYSPDQGLRLSGSGYRTTFEFGKAIGRFADTASHGFKWVEGTQTFITAVPEPSASGLTLSGLAAAAVLWRSRRVRRAS